MFSYIFKRLFNFGTFFSLYSDDMARNFVKSVILTCRNVCIVLQLTPHLCPVQPVHVKCFLQTVYGLNAYEGTKTTNSLHLSERYSAEFRQTIEINEHSHLKQFSQHLNFPVYAISCRTHRSNNADRAF